jgi:hypothetical protein
MNSAVHDAERLAVLRADFRDHLIRRCTHEDDPIVLAQPPTCMLFNVAARSCETSMLMSWL